MVAAAIIRIMKLVWVTYLGALSRINVILIPQILAHPPILAQCKVHRPWALFREGTVILYYIQGLSSLRSLTPLSLCCILLPRTHAQGGKVIGRVIVVVVVVSTKIAISRDIGV